MKLLPVLAISWKCSSPLRYPLSHGSKDLRSGAAQLAVIPQRSRGSQEMDSKVLHARGEVRSRCQQKEMERRQIKKS
jgi:hypothetical protein